MDYSNNQNNSDIGSSSNGINQFLYSNAEQNQSHDSFNDMQNIGQQPNRQQRPQSSYANAQKMAQMQKVKEMQKQQYQQKKKLIFGDGQRIGPEDDRFSLDKMKLDGDDKGGAAHMFDPFAKKDILDLQLQAQMNIMNIDNTYGNKFWTPEQQQKMAALRQQQLEQNDNLEEIPDNIRHYNPDAQGFTEAHKQNYPKYSQSVADPNNPNNSQLNGSGYNMNQVQYGNMDTRKGNHEQPKKFLNTDRNEVDNDDYVGQPMGLVGVQDGRSRSKKRRGDVELLEDGQDDLVSENSHQLQQNAMVQFQANMVEDSNGQAAKKKKKKKKKTTKKQDDMNDAGGDYFEEDNQILLGGNQSMPDHENGVVDYQQQQKFDEEKLRRQMEQEEQMRQQELKRQQMEREQRELEEQKRQVEELRRREREMQEDQSRQEQLRRQKEQEDEQEKEKNRKEQLKRQVEELKMQQEKEEQLRQQRERERQMQAQEQENIQKLLHERQQQMQQQQQQQQQTQMQSGAPAYYQPGIIPQQEIKADHRDAYNMFIQKITNPYTSVEELRYLFMRPVPPNIGQIQCTIVRHKSGFNRLWPKYTLHLSDGEKFLLSGKKRSGNATSNYMISIDESKLKKNTKGYLGKLRSNFLGTEFYIYDNGENPKKAKSMEEVRSQLGVVEYEKNVLGSKGPRRMKVLLPKVQRDTTAFEWKSTDKNYTIENMFRSGSNENIMFFFNKPPKWNEQVQAFVLNFNGRVDKASVKNFQLIDDFDDNKIYMQFGRIGKHKFNMDVAFPCSIFQAFGIALSSFDFKFACE